MHLYSIYRNAASNPLGTQHVRVHRTVLAARQTFEASRLSAANADPSSTGLLTFVLVSTSPLVDGRYIC